METKKCSKCGETKPVGEFYKRSVSKDGLNYYCKECSKASASQWNKEHPEQKYAANRRWQKNHPEHVRAKGRERMKRWYKRHPEQGRAARARWYKRHPERGCAASAHWIKTHPEYPASWRKEHREETRRYCNTRRSLKRALPATLTNKEWQQIKLLAGNACTYCDCKFSSKLKAVQDHFIPLSKGGAYTKENIVPACQSCNSRKGNKVFKDIHEAREWLSSKL